MAQGSAKSGRPRKARGPPPWKGRNPWGWVDEADDYEQRSIREDEVVRRSGYRNDLPIIPQVDSASESPRLRWERLRFLKVTDQLAPAILQDLATEPRAFLTAAVNAREVQRLQLEGVPEGWESVKKLCRRRHGSPSLPNLSRFKRELIRWSKRHNLDAEWVLQEATRCLAVEHWSRNPHRLRWPPPEGFVQPDPTLDLGDRPETLGRGESFEGLTMRIRAWDDRAMAARRAYQPPVWNPALDSEQDYQRKVGEYVRRKRVAIVRLGLRQLSRQEEAAHFEWLARRQVCGESWSVISRGSSPTVRTRGKDQASRKNSDRTAIDLQLAGQADKRPGETAVRKSANQLAKRLGLGLRPAPGK